VHRCGTSPSESDRIFRSHHHRAAIALETIDASRGRREQRQVRCQNRVLKIQRNLRERCRREMQNLEQFRTSLLLRWIHILIALDNINIDGQLIEPVRQWPVTLRNLRITLRTEIPDGRRILNQESKIML